MSQIHPTAIIHSNAKIGENCNIGPYCTVGEQVTLHNNVTLVSSVVVDGDTTIGEGTIVYPFATIGLKSQDLKYKDEPTKVIIGKNTTIREHVTIHLATSDGICTKVGDNCLLMVGCHIAHDCIIGNDVIISNSVLLGGHVQVGNSATIGGNSAIHQHVHLGEYAFIGGYSAVVADIVPFAIYTGIRDGEINGANLVGLKRKGFANTDIQNIVQAYKILFAKDSLFKDNINTLQATFPNNELVNKIINFVNRDGSRNICTNYKSHK